MSPFCRFLLEQDHIAVDELIQLLVKLADHFAYLLIQPTQPFRSELVDAILPIRKLFLHQVHMSTHTRLCGLSASSDLTVS